MMVTEQMVTEQIFEIKPLLTKELAVAYEIEKAAYTEPWSLKLIEQSLQAPMTYSLSVGTEQELLGYAIYQVVFGEAHLLNIAIHPQHQKKGLGRKLLDAVIADIKKRDGHSMYLEVRPSNRGAIKLYESLGFRTLMVRERYYANLEDALVMMKEKL